jgi:methenyltetrahydromethanopterin cyclohydrolase
MHWPDLSVNRLARDAVTRLTGDAQRLRVSVQRDERGVTLVDAGITVPGSIDAGLCVAELCMGGLGRVRLAAGATHHWPSWLQVSSSLPVLACMASQYAGWNLAASWARWCWKSIACRRPRCSTRCCAIARSRPRR